MFDYNHHIGDFRSSTGHLSDLEELAYRRLLEVYYSTEMPIPLDLAQVARKIKSTEQIVAQLMKDFFDFQDDGYHNKRCDIEIQMYLDRVADAVKAGKASARRRAEMKMKLAEQEINNNSTTVQRPFNDRSTKDKQASTLPDSLFPASQLNLEEKDKDKYKKRESAAPAKPEPQPAPKKGVFGQFVNVKLSPVEMDALIERFGPEGTCQRIDNLSGYIASKGDKYKSHYATLLQWEARDKKEGRGKTAGGDGSNHPPDYYDKVLAEKAARDGGKK